MRSTVLPLLLVAAAATPLEVNIVEARATKPFCSTINSIITAAKQQAVATTFCASYLSLSTVTSTATVTSTSTATTTTAEAAVTITTALVGCGAPPSSKKRAKREAKAELEERATAKPTKPKPSCFSKYTPSAVVSSACSCLSIPAPTTTVTTTTITTTTTTVDSQPTATFTGPFQLGFSTGAYGVVDGQLIYITGTEASGNTFLLAPNGNLISPGQANVAGVVDEPGIAAGVTFYGSGFAPIVCQITSSGALCPFTCTAATDDASGDASYAQQDITGRPEWDLGAADSGVDSQPGFQQVSVYAVSV